MSEENISQEFRLKNIDEARNYLIKEIKQNELISKKQKTVYACLDYIEHIVLGSALTGCFSISSFVSLIGIPIGITIPGIRLKICAMTVGSKKYESIVKKNKKKLDKILLLAKFKSNKIGLLISKALIDSAISHDKFLLINNVL